MKSLPLNLVGKRFSQLTVLERAPNKGKRTAWLCRCDCGAATTTLGKYLVSGETTSCGCRKRAALGESRTKHGKFGTPEYWVWAKVLGRCGNPKDKAWPRYGGRGIKVCERWMVFENFLADMGERPSPKHSVDRIDNDGDYEPSNCRWATPTEQVNNRRNTLKVGNKPLTQWAADNNIPYGTAYYRLKRGCISSDVEAPYGENIHFELED